MKPTPDAEIPNLRAPAVAQLLGVSVSTLYKRLAEGTAPVSYLVSDRLRLWRHGDVLAYLEKRRTNGGKAIANGSPRKGAK